MTDARPRRFQLSIRSLMLLCAVMAVLLAPVAWVVRERRHMLQLQQEMLRAREVALLSVVREGESRRRQALSEAKSDSEMELKKQNELLRSQLEELRREVGQLRDQAAKNHPEQDQP